jgi:hypothetical protein
MSDGCSRNSKSNDLTAKKVACMLWYMPAALLLVGWHWPEARVWLCIPALLVMVGAAWLTQLAAAGCTVTSQARPTFSPLSILCCMFSA